MRTRSLQQPQSPLRKPLAHHRVESICRALADNDSQNTPVSSGLSSDHECCYLFTSIYAPVLHSVNPIQAAKFFKEREGYELETGSKQAAVPTLRNTPYTASIDRSLLKHLVFMSCFDDISPEAIVESQNSELIKEYLLSFVKNKKIMHDPARIREAMEDI